MIWLMIFVFAAGMVILFMSFETNESTLFSIALILFIISIFSHIYSKNEPKSKPQLYECNCIIEDLVKETVYHYNKNTGDTTVTTFLNLKNNCIKLKN